MNSMIHTDAAYASGCALWRRGAPELCVDQKRLLVQVGSANPGTHAQLHKLVCALCDRYVQESPCFRSRIYVELKPDSG